MIATIIFLLIAFSVPIALFVWKKKNSLPDEPIDGIDGLADTDIVCIPYQKEWITLTKIDYLNNWLNMTRRKKSEILENQKKAVKRGDAEKVLFGRELKDGRYYIRATKKGRQFLSIHQKKDELYREEK